MLLVTGCRKAEVVTMRWDNIDHNTKRIVLTTFKGQTRAGAEPKSISLTSAVRTILEQAESWRRKDNPHVFPARRVTPAQGAHGAFGGLEKAWRKFRSEYLNRPDIRIHDLRHIVGSTAVSEANLDLLTTSKLLGHQQVATTERYARPQADPIRRAAEKVSETMTELLNATHEAEASDC